jgi:hypothetical protein
MELATCPAGESNRARSLIGKALSKAPVEPWSPCDSIDHKSDDKSESIAIIETVRTELALLPSRSTHTLYRHPYLQYVKTKQVLL